MIYTILDIETTGFKIHSDDILEVGYIQVNENLDVLRYGNLYFYKEQFNIESDAQQVHKLTRDFLSVHEDAFNGNLVRLYTLMQSGRIIGKHSNQFDIPFIISFLERYAIGVNKVSILESIDLEEFYTSIYRGWYKKTHNGETTRKKGQLSELVEMLGYSQDKVQSMFSHHIKDIHRNMAHSALYDAYMTFILLERAKSQYSLRLGTKVDPYVELIRNIVTIDYDLSSFPELFPTIFLDLEKYYNLAAVQRVNQNGYFDFRAKCLNLKLAIELRDGERKGFIFTHNGLRSFVIADVIYWLIEDYLYTHDEVFLILADILYRFVGLNLRNGISDYAGVVNLETQSIIAYLKNAIQVNPTIMDFNISAHDSSLISTLFAYVTFRNTGRFADKYCNVGDISMISLYKRNPVEYWRKALPSSDFLFLDFLENASTWSIGGAKGISRLINARGGLL